MEEEFENALGKVKLRKAGGTCSIVPEILVLCGSGLVAWVCSQSCVDMIFVTRKLVEEG